MVNNIIAYVDDWYVSFAFYMTISQHFQSDAHKKYQNFKSNKEKPKKKNNSTHLTRSCYVSMNNTNFEENP